MWSDNETTEDLLGFKVHADLIIDVIKDDTVLPITIGVFGDWGSGKSSILRIISDEIQKLEDGTFVLFFKGWVFEGYDDAKAALLETIIKAFDENKTFGSEVKDKTKKLLKSVHWMRLLGLGFKHIAIPTLTAALTGGSSLIPYLAGRLTDLTSNPDELLSKLKAGTSEDFLKSLIKEHPPEEETKLVRDFRDDFSEMIMKSKIKKLVVIIDDLDRCTPDRIIENLEAIKLFLNVENTAFVIGADPRIVRHAIEYRFKPTHDDSNNRIVEDYLEKLIQIPYYLPKLSDSEIETYISLLICKQVLGIDAYIKVLEIFSTFRDGDRYSVFGLANMKELVSLEEHEKLTKRLSAIAPLVPLISTALYSNPRQIKRFLNTFILRKRLAEVAKIRDFDDAILAKLMILEYAELPLFKQVYEWQILQSGVPDQINKLEILCKEKQFEKTKSEIEKTDFKSWAKDKVFQWINAAPPLTGVDLRDYFWISRDRITSSIPGGSLVPPLIRAIFNELEADIPVTASKKLIRDKVLALTQIEQKQFLQFASEMLKKNPKKKRLFDLFLYMLEENIPDTQSYYKEALLATSTSDIEASVATSLKAYKDDSDFGPFLIEYFSKDKTKAEKAFNLM